MYTPLQVIRLPIDLGCLNDELVSRLAHRFEVEGLERLRDKKVCYLVITPRGDCATRRSTLLSTRTPAYPNPNPHPKPDPKPNPNPNPKPDPNPSPSPNPNPNPNPDPNPNLDPNPNPSPNPNPNPNPSPNPNP